MLMAFGEPVPQFVIDELLEEGVPLSDITTDLIETNYYYEWLDCQ